MPVQIIQFVRASKKISHKHLLRFFKEESIVILDKEIWTCLEKLALNSNMNKRRAKESQRKPYRALTRFWAMFSNHNS